MKRSELTEGLEVYWAESNTYEEHTYGRQGKATVLMVAARKLGPRWEHPARYAPVEPTDSDYSYAPVLVHVEDRGRELVPLNQLRGPYAETWARVQEVRANIARHQQERAGRDAAQRAESIKLAKRLRDLLGLPQPEGCSNPSGIDDTGRYGDGRHVTLTLEAAQRIATVLAEHLDCKPY